MGFFVASTVGLAAPAPFGYTVGPAFGGISFNAPTQVVFAPGETNRAFVVEQAGRIAMVPDLTHPVRQVILDLSASLAQDDSGHGALSIVFHPQFAQNGYFYLWTPIWQGTSRYLQLLRYTLSAAGTVDPASQLVILNQPVGAGGHDGGTVLFGPDGYLYLSIGDGDEGAAGAEAIASHQRIDRGFFGGVFRIDVDKRAGNLVPNPHLGQVAANYLVPADNPFVGATSFNGSAIDPTQVRTEFWVAGLRNPFRMAFDSATGQLWVGDVGLSSREEVDVILKGANYGWNFLEGTIPGPAAAQMPAGIVFTSPVWEYDHSQGDNCIIGGPIYHGSLFPEMDGTYLFGDEGSGRIWVAASSATQPFAAASVSLIATTDGVTDIVEQPGTGDLLLVNITHNSIQRLVAAAPNGPSGPPQFTFQPVSQTNAGAGGTVAFSVGATGPAPLTYQWFLNGVPLVGATSPLLVLSQVSASEAGSYTCEIVSASGALMGAPANLTVAAAAPGARLVNLSIRAPAGSGQNVLTSGFVIDGPISKTVLIRATGPTLTAFGIVAPLPDPVLRLFSGTQQIGQNSGWGGDSQIAATARTVGAFAWPSGSADAALLVSLPPGAYSVQAAADSSDNGVVLLEVYEVQ